MSHFLNTVTYRALYNLRTLLNYLIPQFKAHFITVTKIYWLWHEKSINVKIESFVRCRKNILCWQTQQKWGLRCTGSVRVYSGLCKRHVQLSLSFIEKCIKQRRGIMKPFFLPRSAFEIKTFLYRSHYLSFS